MGLRKSIASAALAAPDIGADPLIDDDHHARASARTACAVFGGTIAAVPARVARLRRPSCAALARATEGKGEVG